MEIKAKVHNLQTVYSLNAEEEKLIRDKGIHYFAYTLLQNSDSRQNVFPIKQVGLYLKAIRTVRPARLNSCVTSRS